MNKQRGWVSGPGATPAIRYWSAIGRFPVPNGSIDACLLSTPPLKAGNYTAAKDGSHLRGNYTLKQRGFVIPGIAISLIMYLVIGVIGAGTIWFAWDAFTGKYVKQGIAAQKIETDRVAKELDDVQKTFLAYRTEAEARAAKALAFIAELQQQAADAVKQEVIRYVTRTKYIRERIAAVPALPPAVASVRFPAAAASVLDAIGLAATSGSDPAAAAGPAGSPAGDPAAAAKDATIGDVVGWCSNAAEQFATCREKLVGWNSWYADLRGKRSVAAEASGVIRQPHMALFTVHPSEDLQ